MRVRWLVLVVAAVVVLAAFAWQVYDLWGVKHGRFSDDSQLKLQVAVAPQTGMGLEQIAVLHLFGNRAAMPVVAAVPTELPKTDLKLQLIGAITNSNAQKASALIAAENQTKRFYVGDNVPGGAVLHEVRADSVVLKRDNRFEVLDFPKGGELGLQAKSALANMGVILPSPTAVPIDNAVANQTSANAKSQPDVEKKPANVKPKGLTLRERLQRTPRNSQAAPSQ